MTPQLILIQLHVLVLVTSILNRDVRNNIYELKKGLGRHCADVTYRYAVVLGKKRLAIGRGTVLDDRNDIPPCFQRNKYICSRFVRRNLININQHIFRFFFEIYSTTIIIKRK